MKPQTQRAIDIFCGIAAHQYQTLQSMLHAAQQYIEIPRRMADVIEIVSVLDSAQSDDDPAAIAAIERNLSYYRHRAWSLSIMDISYGSEQPDTLPYVEADGTISTVAVSNWARFADFEGCDRFFNPTVTTLICDDITPEHMLMRSVVNSNNSCEVYAILSRPANIIKLSRNEGDLYYGGRGVVCHPSITTQDHLFKLLAAQQESLPNNALAADFEKGAEEN